MGIIKQEKKGGVTVYHVKKDITDAEMAKKKGSFFCTPKHVLKDDADVYTEEGDLLLRFRRDVLPKNKIKDCYDNVSKFAKQLTATRGTSSGNKGLHAKVQKKSDRKMTNILGYYDKWSIKNKQIFKELGLAKNHPIRKHAVHETRFNRLYPENWLKVRPLIQEIDAWYKKLVPDKYKKQRKKANQTPYRIKNTAFTTVTTNLNYQTALHTDKGDDAEGFGNLVVIEDGKYDGAETCFPQYGIGVDLRTGGVLYMDVHQWHCNAPMRPKSAGAKRLSLVCYLRLDIWKQTKGMSMAQREKFDRLGETLKKKYRKMKGIKVPRSERKRKSGEKNKKRTKKRDKKKKKGGKRRRTRKTRKIRFW